MGLGLVYGLSHLAGGKIDEDGKIHFGQSVLDPTAGLSSVFRLIRKTAPGLLAGVGIGKRPARKFGQNDEFNELMNFGRKKLAPIPGAVASVWTGKDANGDKTTLGREAVKLTHPMSVEDIYKATKEHGFPGGAALGVLSLFGMNLQHYDKRGR